MAEQKQGDILSFTQRYRTTRLVYYQSTPDIQSAIQREKQIKGWLRRKKVTLITYMNPYWKDLSETFEAAKRDPSLRSG